MKYITQLGYIYAHTTIHQEDHWVQGARGIHVGVNVCMNESCHNTHTYTKRGQNNGNQCRWYEVIPSPECLGVLGRCLPNKDNLVLQSVSMRTLLV